MILPNNRDNQSDKNLVVGIDLGTTNSSIFVSRDGGITAETIAPSVYHEQFVNVLLPSVYCDASPGSRVCGAQALHMLKDKRFRDRVVSNVKRKMRTPNCILPDIATRVDKEIPQTNAIQISAFFLQCLKRELSKQLGINEGELNHVVVGVPALFGAIARRATETACNIAGFSHVDLLAEPVAAAFGLRLHESPHDKLVMIIDLGGGTFDVTLMRVGAMVGKGGFQILGIDGDSRLGGLDWDRKVFELAMCKIPDPAKADSSESLFDTDPDIATDCEAAKIALFRAYRDGRRNFTQPVNLRIGSELCHSSVTLSSFLQETEYLLQRICNICNRVIANYDNEVGVKDFLRRKRGWKSFFLRTSKNPLSWDDIDEIHLVGGGAFMKPLEERINAISGKVSVPASNPQIMTAVGAAICGSRRDTDTDLFKFMEQRSPYTVALRYFAAVRKPQYRVLIRCNEKIPEGGLKKDFKHSVTGDASVLVARFFEQNVNEDPPTWEPAEELRIPSLPPRTKLEESVDIQLHCDEQLRLSAKVKFRGESIDGELKPPQEE